MSSLRGTTPPPGQRRGSRRVRCAAVGDAEQRGEVLEEVGAVVGTGAGLRVVLHAERGRVEHAEALAHAVVEVHVAHLGPAAERIGVDGEVVVLARDLDAAGGEVAHRVVATVVAERELHRARAEGATEQLVPEADAEDRDVPEQPRDRVAGVRHGGGIARAVGEEHPGGLAGQDVGGGRRRGHHLHVEPRREVAQDRALDAEVVGHHERTRTVGEAVGIARGHLGDEVDPVGAGLCTRGREERRLVGGVEGSERTRDGADGADATRELARVDASDAGDAVGAELGVEVGLAPPARPATSQVAHHDTAAERALGLEVGQVHAVVADVGVGERDDLPRVGRVGDHLLVAREHRVEHHLARRDGVRADGLPLEGGPVRQDQQRVPHRHGVPLVCILMRLSVWVIAGPPRRRRPAHRGAGCGGPAP